MFNYMHLKMAKKKSFNLRPGKYFIQVCKNTLNRIEQQAQCLDTSVSSSKKEK